jgi:drug/metabolite transporter (DMT)-like permease
MRAEPRVSPHPRTHAPKIGLVVGMAMWGLNVTAIKQLAESFETSWSAALRMIVAVLALSVMVACKRPGLLRCSAN